MSDPDDKPSRVLHELEIALVLWTQGVAPTLTDAIEICLRHSNEGPFTPQEVELLRDAARVKDKTP